MADKKSILEEALLDIKNIQNALNANTKEILRSVAREEINSVVKESLLKEDDYEEEDLEANDNPVDLGGDADAATADMTGDLAADNSVDGEANDIEGSQEVVPTEPEIGMDADALGGEEIDMTSQSDDDVIAIYKKLSGEDEIEIVGDEIHLNITEPGEYVVKATDAVVGDEAATTADDTTDLVPAIGADDAESTDGVDYEIEMGDDEAENGEEPSTDDLIPAGDDEESEEDSEEEETEELTEAIPVGSAQAHRLPGKTDIGQPKGAGADNLKESKSDELVLVTKKYNTVLTESNKLKAENDEFRKALKEFRQKLVETVVFNSNLTYVTKLFMEHSTTKAEKQSIIKRFDDEVSSIKESKKLYKTIVSELENRKPVNESVESKIIKEVTTSTSKQLNESTAYVDPSTKRIIDLINRVEKK